MKNPEIVALEKKEDSFMAESFVDNVYRDMDDIKHSFFRIGFRLWEANELGYYKALGYRNITELAEDKFGFKSSTTYELIGVYELARDERAPMQIADRFDKFSKSQLTEISKVRYWVNDFMKIVSPSDTVANIREAVKIWNKKYLNSSCTTAKSIAELIEKYGNEEKPAVQSGQLPGQTVIEIPEPQQENFSEYPENTDELNEAEELKTVAETPEEGKRQEAEIIKAGLKGVDIYVKDAKYLIYDHYRNEPLNGDFTEFVKSVYSYNKKPDFYHGFAAADMHRCYSEKGVEFICFEPYQNVKINWEEAARCISDLIYTDDYLSEEELEHYLQWKAKRDGLVVNVGPAAAPAQTEPQQEENSGYLENLDDEPRLTRRKQLEELSNSEFAKELCKYIYKKSLGYTDFMPLESSMREWLIEWLDEVVE